VVDHIRNCPSYYAEGVASCVQRALTVVANSLSLSVKSLMVPPILGHRAQVEPHETGDKGALLKLSRGKCRLKVQFLCRSPSLVAPSESSGYAADIL
jgi:hypothetical protein